MNLKRLKAITLKEFLHIGRDRRSLMLAIALPVFMVFIFGFALTLDIDRVRLAVWDQDHSRTSRDFIREFENSRYFRIAGYSGNYAGIQKEIDKNNVLMALVIPRDFSKLILSGAKTPVQLIVDGSDSNTATIALGYVSGVCRNYNLGLVKASFSREGPADPAPVDLRARVWFNPDLKSRNFIIPGLIAVIMMIIAGLLTSLTVAREWEKGTMEQLISTPVRSGELILGKLIPYLAIGLCDLLIVMVMGQFVFSVPLRGSLVLLFAVSCIFLFGAMSLGILLSVITKNQMLACQVAIIVTFLPAFILSGFMYPISNMPKVIQAVTYLLPARYYIYILKGIYLKGVSWQVLWLQIVLLSAFAAAMFILANKKFRKRTA